MSDWKLTYDHFKPQEEGLREALCTLGNGYFATRGALPESSDVTTSYSGTYVLGLYNKTPSPIAGRTIYNEDLVNCPNWIPLMFRVGNGAWISLYTTKILSFYQELDMYQGLLHRRIKFKDKQGRITLIESDRIVHMGKPHLAAMRYRIIPQNYSHDITVRTMLDGSVTNDGVARYRQLNSQHWKLLSCGAFMRNGIFLSMRTTQSKIEIAQAEKVEVFLAHKRIEPVIKHLRRASVVQGKKIAQEFTVKVSRKAPLCIEKYVSLYTSRDKEIKNPFRNAISSVRKVKSFKSLLQSHTKSWRELWQKCDIRIEGDHFSQKALRLHAFHLLQTFSPHSVGADAAFPARGLHGEAYRGHIFWDELYLMPFYNLHLPELSKTSLLYRYRRLDKARAYARKAGYRGAMFPWQSGSTGVEETQIVHLNPRSGKWGPDYSRIQRHISISIAYSIWRYWEKTYDRTFLKDFGAEMFLSIVQFFTSMAEYSARQNKYHIRGVMGPDEFHEKMPRSSQAGITDNAYTNGMVVWMILRAQEILSFLPQKQKKRLLSKLKLKEKELDRWEDISRKLDIVIDQEGIIAQFAGYFGLKELDWEYYRKKYKHIGRMDRILKAEGKSPDEYKLSKQADVLMLFYLLPFEEVVAIFDRLGFHMNRRIVHRNYVYYLKRTSHGSTLSKVVHSFIAQKFGKERDAWKWFHGVLKSDIYDTQGGTTPEGIHGGVMGGSLDCVMRAFAGLSFREGRIYIDPHLPRKWRRISFCFSYRQIRFCLSLTRRQLMLTAKKTAKKRSLIPLEINARPYKIYPGKTITVSLHRGKR